MREYKQFPAAHIYHTRQEEPSKIENPTSFMHDALFTSLIYYSCRQLRYLKARARDLITQIFEV